MNISTRANSRSAGWILHFLGIVLVLAVVAALLAVYAATGFVRLSRDTGALRDSLMRSTAVNWNKQVEINVGPLTLGLVRFGLSFIDLDPDGRLALTACRGAEVGVYHLQEGHVCEPYAAVLSSADQAMSARGWERMVGVLHTRELVAVYVPKKMNSAKEVRVCVLVLNGQDLVVVSARSNLEPLLQLAWKHASRNEGQRLLSQLESKN
jgi:hypothetical protein